MSDNEICIEPEYVLPVVLHLEKDSTLTHQEALELMAYGMMEFLKDSRCSPGGEWYETVQAWSTGNRFRKVVRRARGAKWSNIADSGVIFSKNSAEIAILPPVLLGEESKEVKMLQVAGLNLPRTKENVTAPGVLQVGINKGLWDVMSTGKCMAQVGHAVQLAIINSPSLLERDISIGITVQYESDLESWTGVIRDAGFTEIPPNSVTTAYKWARRATD